MNSGGVLSRGNIFGTLTVNNTVTMLPGSKMLVDVISSSGLSDKLSTGTNKLTLNGTLEITNSSTSPYEAGNSFTIINGSNISGSFTTITPENPGSGLVWDTTLLRSNGVIRVDYETNVEKYKDVNFSVYPNPTNGKIWIAMDKFFGSKISIENLNGQKIISSTANANMVVIDLSSYPSGIYVMKLKTYTGVYSKKIIKR